MQNRLHLVVHLVRYRRIYRHEAPDLVEILAHDGLEEVCHLVVCVIALIDHRVVGLVANGPGKLDLSDGFKLFMHHLVVSLRFVVHLLQVLQQFTAIRWEKPFDNDFLILDIISFVCWGEFMML